MFICCSYNFVFVRIAALETSPCLCYCAPSNNCIFHQYSIIGSFLGEFSNPQRGFIFPAVWVIEITRRLLHGLSWYLIMGNCIQICRNGLFLVKLGNCQGALHMGIYMPFWSYMEHKCLSESGQSRTKVVDKNQTPFIFKSLSFLRVQRWTHVMGWAYFLNCVFDDQQRSTEHSRRLLNNQQWVFEHIRRTYWVHPHLWRALLGRPARLSICRRAWTYKLENAELIFK
jgi:hypothetical protein